MEALCQLSYSPAVVHERYRLHNDATPSERAMEAVSMVVSRAG